MYEKYSDAIFGIICRTVKDNQTAEEVLQQTMLKAWNKIELYQENKSLLYTWLSAIARNTAIDTIRLKSYQNNQKTEKLDLNVYTDIETNDNVELKIDVSKLTSLLDIKYRIIIDKIYLEGYSQKDLSKELDIPIGTIKTRLRTGIKLLRDELKTEHKLFFGLLLLILLLLSCH